MRSILRALFQKDRRRRGMNACPSKDRRTASCGVQGFQTAWAYSRVPLRTTKPTASCGVPFLSAIIFAVTAFLCANASAQDFAVITGTITDDVMFQAIAGVVVTVLPEGTTTISDSDGRYRIVRVMPGTVSVQFASAFFVKTQSPAMLVREGELATVDVALHPVIVKAATQTVSAERVSNAGVQQYTAPQIRQSSRCDVGGFLNENGYQIQSDGRAQYLSLGGLSPQRTLVLLDGVRINPDGGAADLSQISLSSIERIEVYTSGAAARFGDGALGGAVNIISRRIEKKRNSGVSLRSAVGSYSLIGESLQLTRNDLAGLQVLGNYEYGFSRNDYAFAHPYLGEQRRANNFSRQASYFITLSHDNLQPLTLSARHYDSHHGIPGAVLQETPTASARHVNTHFTANFATPTLRFAGSYRELTQHYRDAQSVSRYDKHYLQVVRQFDLEKQWSLRRRLDIALGSQYLSESFFNDDRLQSQSSLPSISRKTSAVFGRGKLRQNLWLLQSDYSLAYRLDHVNGRSYHSPHLALSFSFDQYVNANVTANYAESFRLPSIDALFWSNDVFAIGNPDLQAERARSRDVQLSVASKGRMIVTIQVRRFVNDVDGMIFWRQRFDGKYTPVNLARARVDGTEAGLTVRYCRRSIIARHRGRSTCHAPRITTAKSFRFSPIGARE
jgi:outer membrane cobalamin receptor